MVDTELIIVIETNKSNNSDYMYIKSTLDYYFTPRQYGITPIYAKTKTELKKQDTKINAAIKKCSCNGRTPRIFIVADYDRDEKENGDIIKYCAQNKYDLIWMNKTIEHVYWGVTLTRSKDKHIYAENFMKSKDKLLPRLTNLSNKNPISTPKSSNILIIFNKYLKLNK